MSGAGDKRARRDDEDTSDIDGHLEPLVANAAWEAIGLGEGRVTLSKAAQRGLGEALGKRLAAMTGPVLRHMMAAGTIGDEASAQGWNAVFAQHPDLAPIVEKAIEDWRGATARFLARYAADAAQLGDASATLSAVVATGGGLRKSPTLRVTTGADDTYYYKDRPQAISAWLIELVRRLNACGLRHPLHVRRVAVGAGYGWDEAVAPEPCASASQAERYYWRIGAWLRLMEALAGNDLGSKNLIAAGEHPVPIDCESLFQPPRATGQNALSSARRARQRSVLEPGILPQYLSGEPGRRALNAGGLEAGGVVELPHASDAGPVRVTLPRTMPMLDGWVVEPREHIAAMHAGFGAMQVLLHGPGTAVLEGMLTHAVACEVRAFRRPGFESRRLIAASLRPEVLAEPGARAKLIAAQAHPEDRAAIGDVELPRSYQWPEIGAAGTLREHSELERDKAMITTAVGCVRAARIGVGASPIAGLEVGAPGAGAEVSVSEDERTGVMYKAMAVGDAILAEAHGDRGSLHWLGVTWQPLSGSAQVEVLPNDLLSGNAGLAVMFAALHLVSEEARFGDAARRALTPVARALAAPTMRGAWRPWGAYVGSGAQIYAVERVAELLDQPAVAKAPVEQLLEAPSGGIDLATGIAGLVAVAARGKSAPKWCIGLGDVLRATMDARPALPYPDGRMPAYLPDAATGIAHALTRLAKTRGNERFGEGIAARDPAWWDVGDADALMRRHAQSGSWFPDSGLDDRLNVGGMMGTGAVVLALLRKCAPEAGIPSLWRLD